MTFRTTAVQGCAIAMAGITAVLANTRSVGAAELPQDHPYQKVLRDYIGSLSEKDFDHGFEDPAGFTVAVPEDSEAAFRDYILSFGVQPVIGSKRGSPCVTAPPWLFTLKNIESEEGVRLPPIWPIPTAWLANWKYEGNPYYQSKPMKRRAIVHCIIDMLMVQHEWDAGTQFAGNRSDWFAPHLLRYAYSYVYAHDVMPPQVQAAYKEGLGKMLRQQLEWGIRGDETNQDMAAAPAVYFASVALDDDAVTKDCKAYLRELIAGKDTFHPAGYFVDRGGPEMGFGGMTAFLANWAALASGYDFAEDAVRRRFTLRAYMGLPEPDGKTMLGPCHFNTRLDSSAVHDQWNWSFRHYGAVMLSDEAVHLIHIPTREEIEAGHRTMVSKFNGMVKQNPRRRLENGKLEFIESQDLKGRVWKYSIWPSWNYPIAGCFPHEHYREGTYAKLLKLKASNSPLLKNPYEREGTFIRNFEDAFTVAKAGSFAAIVHTGTVGIDPAGKEIFHFPGPHGFGGGQLSAFWTAGTGSIVLARRGGMNWDNNYDPIDAWKAWPIHAVTGRKGFAEPEAAEGEAKAEADTEPAAPKPRVFTSGRITAPAVDSSVSDKAATIRVSGDIPADSLGQGKVLDGTIAYARKFEIDMDGVTVKTSVRGDGADTIDELYETIPLLIRGGRQNADAINFTVEFQVGAKWVEATASFHEKVTDVRVMRWDGGMVLTFDRPRRVALSPEPFSSKYTSRVTSRNVMVDLLENGDKPAVLSGEKKVGYRITPIDRPAKAEASAN